MNVKTLIYRTADAAPWFTWNRYPGSIIGFAVRVAPRHLLSIVWGKPKPIPTIEDQVREIWQGGSR
jgi:hypothetical protein